MAIRKIREAGEGVLTKPCKEIKEMTARLSQVIDDMIETLHGADGVGLAAPQVGILKRLVIIDMGDGPVVLINPRIVEASGEQTGDEACLSLPGKVGTVTRPNYVKVLALDQKMQPFEYEGTELTARCICHELDHLEGKLYTERVEGGLRDAGQYNEEDEEE